MIEVEIQNETHQTQERIRFAAVPRIGEGIRLREPDGVWASYDVLDVWYQKAEFGDVWMPYLHICMTPGEVAADEEPAAVVQAEPRYVPEPQAPETYAPNPYAQPEYAQHAYAEEHEEESPHEDDGHELHGEGAFASLAGEVEPFKI